MRLRHQLLPAGVEPRVLEEFEARDLRHAHIGRPLRAEISGRLCEGTLKYMSVSVERIWMNIESPTYLAGGAGYVSPNTAVTLSV